jgi:hypothetical protein
LFDSARQGEQIAVTTGRRIEPELVQLTELPVGRCAPFSSRV